MKAKNFDRKFDEGKDISADLDLAQEVVKGLHSNLTPKAVAF